MSLQEAINRSRMANFNAPKPEPVADQPRDYSRQPLSRLDHLEATVVEMKVIQDAMLAERGKLAEEELDLTPRPTMKLIKRVVGKHYNLSHDELISQRRLKPLVFPRQIAMHLCKRLTLKSLPEIGRHFDRRDHTTVMHANRKIANLRLVDLGLDQLLNELEKKIMETTASEQAASAPLVIGESR